MIKGGLIIVYLLILSVFDGKEKAVPIILLVLFLQQWVLLTTSRICFLFVPVTGTAENQ